MREQGLMNESPSIILSKLSNDESEYFFQKYLDKQVELRRKLRKRFDNVVNIDIKKIGKTEEEKEEMNKLHVEPLIKVEQNKGKKNEKKEVMKSEEIL